MLTLLVAVLLVVVPGLLLAFGLGIRGWTAAGVSPALTAGVLLLAVLGTSALGIAWTPLSAGVVAVLVVALASVATVLVRRRRPVQEPTRDGDGGATAVDGLRDSRLWAVLAGVGLAVGSAIGFLTITRGTGDLADPNQGFDAPFHVTLVELITRTGDVSPSAASALNGYPDGTLVYPDAMHALASLVAQLGGSTITGINALLACIPLLAGLGLVGLLRSVGLVREAAVAPVVLAATTGYPIDLIWRGPIWVFVFGITFIPAFVLLLRHTLQRRSVLLALALGVAAAGIALLHPSAALSAGVFSVCLVVHRWWSDRSLLRRELLPLGVAGVLAAVLAVPLLGQAIVNSGGGTVVDWPVAQTTGQAFGDLLLYNYENQYPQVWLAVPALIGIVAGWRLRPLRSWWVGTAVFLALCVLAAAYDGTVVQLLTGPWWNDRFRFEGVFYLGMSVFAAVGVVAIGTAIGRLVTALTGRLGERAAPVRRVAAGAGVLVAVLLLGVLSSGFYTGENTDRLRLAYGIGPGGSITEADLVAYRELREFAGTGPVLNDPNDGSPWMWPLAGVRPVFGAALTVPVEPPLPTERQVLIDGLNCLDSNTDVRTALEDLGVRYVFVSDGTILGGPTSTVGFRDLGSTESLRPVYQDGNAVVYEIDLQPLRPRSTTDACELR